MTSYAISFYFTSFISDFIYLATFSSPLDDLVYLFQEQALGLIYLFYHFLDSILIISALIFIISFLLLTLSLVCSFSSSCKHEDRMFIRAFSCFLRQACNAMNLPLRIAFPVSHRFWIVCFHFHLFQGIWISSSILLLTHSLFNNMLFSFHVFACFSLFL